MCLVQINYNTEYCMQFRSSVGSRTPSKLKASSSSENIHESAEQPAPAASQSPAKVYHSTLPELDRKAGSENDSAYFDFVPVSPFVFVWLVALSSKIILLSRFHSICCSTTFFIRRCIKFYHPLRVVVSF
jgi:hypothetical protein